MKYPIVDDKGGVITAETPFVVSDAKKVKPGLKGKLLVSASGPTLSSSKAKKGSSSKSYGKRLLPAIPFEITQK